MLLPMYFNHMVFTITLILTSFILIDMVLKVLGVKTPVKDGILCEILFFHATSYKAIGHRTQTDAEMDVTRPSVIYGEFVQY